MQKLADFLVNKRILIFIFALIVTAASVVGFFAVNINTDMTKYLADSSSMKQGLNLMEAQFPGSSDVTTINVMVDDLDEPGKKDMKDRLADLNYVERVEFEAGSADYNVDNHTLFQLTTMYPDSAPETASVTQALDEQFTDVSLVWSLANSSYNHLEAWIAMSAVAVLLVILFVMSHSWLEPLLFMLAIGIAIIINMGTNALLPSVSDTTYSIAAILQLVLSMDYSIILVNRFRQERLTEPEPVAAMRKAMRGALPAIGSSSLTTVVGLLSLLFMSFKIGGDIGVVLAKGVFISMLTIFAVMPTLLLACQKGIERTAKPALNVRVGRIAAFDHRFRWPITAAFCLLMVGAFWLQMQTHISFSMESVDEIAKVFTPTNTTVLIYSNDDAEGAAKIADQLEENPDVRSVMSYPSTLGKQYRVEKMNDTLKDLDTDSSDLNESMLRMLYYNYHTNGKLPHMTVAQFLRFLSNDVANDDNFSDRLDKAMHENLNDMKRFSNPDDLTMWRDANGLAEFFGMDAGDVEQLFLLYRIENGYTSKTKMTLDQFIKFILNDLAKDETFGSQIDADTIKQLEQLRNFTNKKSMTKSVNYLGFANTMDINENQAMQLFMLRQVSLGLYQPSTMTLPQLVDFLANDAAKDPTLSKQLDANTLAQVKQLSTFTNKNTISAPTSAQALANALGMSNEQVGGIFALKFGDPSAAGSQSMSLFEFVSFICETMLPDPTYSAMIPAESAAQLQMLYGVMGATMSDQALSPADAASMFGMTESQATMLYAYRDMGAGAAKKWTCSVQDMINWMLDNTDQLGDALDASTLSNLRTAQSIVNDSVKGIEYTPAGLASVLGMEDDQLSKLFLLYDYKKGQLEGLSLSVQQFVHFLCDQVLTNSDYSNIIDAGQAGDLQTARRLIDAVVEGSKLSAKEMYGVFSEMGNAAEKMTLKDTELVFLYFGSKTKFDSMWTMSIEQLANHLHDDVLNDPRFKEAIDKDMRKNIADMKTQIEDALKQLIGPECSRMIVTTTLPTESPETTQFFDQMSEWCSTLLHGENHMIGTSYMGYELQQTFKTESLLIMGITALAIFLVVALSFRSLVVPAILVLLVQCGVWITIAVVGLQGYAINYLAMLIVECILMGATIDYGILTTSNYRESRGSMTSLAALKDACNRSIMTILTSGLIMVTVTAIVGNFFESPALGQICRTISIGSACAMILIIFVLPALLAAFDRWLFPGKNNPAKRATLGKHAAPALDAAPEIDAAPTLDAVSTL